MTFVFDICDTLFQSNTTFDFIHFVMAQRRIKTYWNIFFSRKSPVFYGLALANKILGKDFHKDIAVRLLKGYSIQELDTLATRFYYEYLVPRKNKPVWMLFDDAKKDDQIILLSSTIEPIAKAIAEQNQVTYQASTLEVSGNIATGRIQREMKGRKHEFVDSNTPYTAITDNLSDWTLVKNAHTRYAVVHSPEIKKQWAPLNVRYITLFHE